MKIILKFILLFCLFFTSFASANEGFVVSYEQASVVENTESVNIYNEDCTDCVEPNKWQFGLALGVGYISTPIASEDDTFLPVIPRFSYYGEKFFIDNFSIGYSLIESNAHKLDLIGEFNQDFLHFETASDIQKAFASFIRLNGQVVVIDVGEYNLKPRHATYITGLAYRYFGENWSVRANYGFDAFNVNGGAEASVEIGQNFSNEKWRFEHAVGAVWKSKEIVNYYYGLSREEAPATIAIYEPIESATNPYYRINTQYQFGEDWRFLLSYKTEKLDDVIQQSNIVNEETIESVFIGVGYDF